MGTINLFELKRQAFHISLGIVIAALVYYSVLDATLLLAITAAGFIVSYFSIRHELPLISFMLRHFERKEHIKSFPAKGALFYLAGSYIVVGLFEKDIALAAIIVLALGDSISHIFGRHFGRIKNPLSDRKFIEGAIAGILAGFIGALVFVRWHEALIGAAAAMIAEGLEIKLKREQVDDNLIIPVAAALAMWIVRLLS